MTSTFCKHINSLYSIQMHLHDNPLTPPQPAASGASSYSTAESPSFPYSSSPNRSHIINVALGVKRRGKDGLCSGGPDSADGGSSGGYAQAGTRLARPAGTTTRRQAPQPHLTPPRKLIPLTYGQSNGSCERTVASMSPAFQLHWDRNCSISRQLPFLLASLACMYSRVL